MRVLLIHTNRERAPYPAMPLGLCLVASSLQAAGFAPRLLDLHFSRNPQRDLVRALRAWRPEATGLSIRNLDNGDAIRTRRYLPDVIALAQACRAESLAPVILGGPAVSIAPARLLELTGADYAIVGDGEQAMPALLTALARGDRPESVPGVWSRAAPGAAPLRISDLAALPAAQLDKWLEVGSYLRRGAPVPVQTRRGCGFECTYCTYRFIEGASYRLRPPELAAEEIVAAERRFGARRFDFVDSTFNRPAEHAVALCEAILRARASAELQTTDFNPAGVSKELLTVMKRAGFSSLVCTPESGSPRLLEALRKGFTCEDILRTAAWAHGVGLLVLWMFMFGGPGECEETVQETVKLMEAVVAPQDGVICTIGLRVYPGTELARTAREEGAVAPDADLVQPVFYFSPRITPARVLQLLDASAVRGRMIYLETLQQSVAAWAARAHAALHLPGPLWSAVPLYNRLLGRK